MKGNEKETKETKEKYKWSVSFIIIVTLAFGVFVGHYWLTKSHFEQSCKKICAAHEELCRQLPSTKKIANKDSILVQNAMLKIESGNARIKEILELQHEEIQEDFSSLMLWASVLMVIFLIFSIYSMYKVDDLVNQGRRSVTTIVELSAAAKSRIEEVDNLFETESQKLARQSSEEIDKLKKAQSERLKELDEIIDIKITESERRIAEDIKKFNESIDDKSQSVLKQLSSIEESTKPLTGLLAVIKSSLNEDKNEDGNK